MEIDPTSSIREMIEQSPLQLHTTANSRRHEQPIEWNDARSRFFHPGCR